MTGLDVVVAVVALVVVAAVVFAVVVEDEGSGFSVFLGDTTSSMGAKVILGSSLSVEKRRGKRGMGGGKGAW